jgi:Beta-galactosidase
MGSIRFFRWSSCTERSPRIQKRAATLLLSGVALGLVFGALSWRSPAAKASDPIPAASWPKGLIALEQYRGCDPASGSCPQSALPDNAATNPSIAGLMIRVNWADMEPSEGSFNWDITDAVFAQAVANNKYVVLSFVPGFSTPVWALSGAQTAQFCIPYAAKGGQVGTLPLPWDQTYLAAWSAFLQAVSDRYASNPTFLMIAAAGPTSVSEEMSLPGAEGSSDLCSASQIAQDLATWTSAAVGYTPAKYESAWQTVFQEYAEFFPSQFVSLALYGGLPIGSNGTPDASQRAATRQSIIAEGEAQLVKKFAIEGNGLRPLSAGIDQYALISSSSGKVVTGFELDTSATRDPGRQGDATDPVHALALTLQTGLAAHANFLEIYQPDVVNPAMQAVLQETQSQLLQSPTPP